MIKPEVILPVPCNIDPNWNGEGDVKLLKEPFTVEYLSKEEILEKYGREYEGEL